jgi:hypothetical protein
MIVAAALCALLAAYVGGYLSCDPGGWGTISFRTVTTDFEARLYAPAAWVESLLRGNRVVLLPQDRWWQVAPDGDISRSRQRRLGELPQ